MLVARPPWLGRLELAVTLLVLATAAYHAAARFSTLSVCVMA